MKNIPAPLLAHCQGQSLTLAVCIRITRKDAVVIGLTGLDEPVVIDGTTHYPQGGITATSIKATSTTGIDNMEAVGLISSDLITEADILAKIYDDADILVFQCNYMSPGDGKNVLLRAQLGEIKLEDGQFTVEIRSRMARMKQMVIMSTSPTCRVRRFGDQYCKKNAADYTEFDRSVDSITTGVLRFTDVVETADSYSFGIIVGKTGPNAGLERQIKLGVSNFARTYVDIVLREKFPFTIAPGDTFDLIQGCDRQFITCNGKFNNAVNYRGEPHLSGNARYHQVARPPK